MRYEQSLAGFAEPAPLAICANCGSPRQRPDQRFCTHCGHDLRAPTATPAAPVEGSTRIFTGVGPERKVSSVREGYFELGLQFLDAGRAAEAAQAFDNALREQGYFPGRGVVLLALVRAHVTAGDEAATLRAYLEAAAEYVIPIDLALNHAARRLSPLTAQVHASWIRSEWLPRMIKTTDVESNRAQIHAFAAVVKTCLGELEDALSSFSDAVSADHTGAKNAGITFLSRATLPADLQPDTVENHYFHARVFQIMGDHATALARAEQAINSSPRSSANYPEAPARRLRAELTLAAGKEEQAAEYFFDAGRVYGWRDDFPIAIALLERARRLDPAHAGARWMLSDTYFRWSYETPPANETETECLKKALDAWDEGYAIRKPREHEAWVLATRSLILDRLAEFGVAGSRETANWEAVAYGEQAALLNPHTEYRWSNLSYFYRVVSLQQCALQCAYQGLEIDPKSPRVLQELALNLTNLGYFEDALVQLDALRAIQVTPWTDYVRARLMLYLDRPAEALPAAQAACDKAPDDVNFLGTLGLIQLIIGGQTDAFEKIAARFKATPPRREDRQDLAFSRYMTGDAERAIDLYKELLADASPSSSDFTSCLLALAYLATGHGEAARDLLQKCVPKLLDRESVLLIDLHSRDALRMVTRWPASNEARQILNDTVVKLGKLGDALRLAKRETPLEAATAQLRSALPSQLAAPDDEAASWRWVGAHAGLGRLTLLANDPHTAAESYRALIACRDRFGEAPRGMRHVIEHFMKMGDAQLSSFNAMVASQQYEHAHALVANLDDHSTVDAPLNARRFYSDLIANARADRNLLAETIASYVESGADNPGQSLGVELAGVLRGSTGYWSLDDELARVSRESPHERETLEAAREALSGYLSRQFRMGNRDCDTADLHWIVNPISIEIAQDLEPDGDAAEWPIFTKYLPEMRQRIQTDLGVIAPGVRLRSNTEGDMQEATYLLMLHEVPQLMGTARPGKLFAPVSLQALERIGIAEDSFDRSEDPAGCNGGAWFDSHVAAAIEDAGLGPCLDAHGYIVRHLEVLVRRRLADFLDADQVRILLDQWSEEPDGEALVRSVIAGDSDELRFGRLLRALVAESVSLGQWREILTAVSRERLDNDDVTSLLQATRLHLKPWLAAAARGRKLIEVPIELEEQIRRGVQTVEGRCFLAMTPQDTQAALDKVRELVRSQEKESRALTTRHGETRYFLRRLVELEFPDLAVFARDELG